MRATTKLGLLLVTLAAMPLQAQPAAADGQPAAVADVTPPAPSTLKPVPGRDADTSQPRQRLVTVFGTEPCPKPTSVDEIVVCARLPDSEIYRIPLQQRAANNVRLSPFQANRGLLLGDASGGAGGSIGSCSTNGPGGFIGCSQKQVDAWAQDRTNRMGTTTEIPR